MKPITSTLYDRNKKRSSNVTFNVNDDTYNILNENNIKVDVYIIDNMVLLYAYNDGVDNIATANFETRLLPHGYKEAFKALTTTISTNNNKN
jgi:hypothetical protein